MAKKTQPTKAKTVKSTAEVKLGKTVLPKGGNPHLSTEALELKTETQMKQETEKILKSSQPGYAMGGSPKNKSQKTLSKIPKASTGKK